MEWKFCILYITTWAAPTEIKLTIFANVRKFSDGSINIETIYGNNVDRKLKNPLKNILFNYLSSYKTSNIF